MALAKKLNTKKKTCRCCLSICFTSNIKSIDSMGYDNKEYEHNATIQKMIEYVTNNKLTTQRSLPDSICGVCLSYLKISYEFRIQYDTNEKILNQNMLQSDKETIFREEHTNTEKEPISVPDEEAIFIKEQINSEEQTNLAPVELIYKKKRFPLNSILVVEPNEPPMQFNGFLQNLGKEITACFVKNKKEPMAKVNKSISIIPLQKNKVGTKPVIVNSPLKMKTRRSNVKESFMYVCDLCGQIITNARAVWSHKFSHRGLIFKCDVCGKAFKTTTHLKQHMRKHFDPEQFLCNMCGRIFNSKLALSYHIKKHQNIRDFKCDFCCLTFISMSARNSHRATNHIKERRFTCKVCDKSFLFQSRLREHMFVHGGVRPHLCKYCGKRFSKSSNLTTHYLSHSGQFVCNICGNRSFLEAKFLEMHMKRTHLKKIKINNDESDDKQESEYEDENEVLNALNNIV